MEKFKGLSAYLSELDAMLSQLGVRIEGNCGELGLEAQRDLYNSLPRTISKDQVNILEIGFNAGHSSTCFLAGNPNVRLVSFDLGEHDYVYLAKDFIDRSFPGQHQLILGDSAVEIANFGHMTDQKFDIILIDGDHSLEGVTKDITNCKALATAETVIIGDDVVLDPTMHKPWSVDTTQAWVAALDRGLITQLNQSTMKQGRGFAVGHYKF